MWWFCSFITKPEVPHPAPFPGISMGLWIPRGPTQCLGTPSLQEMPPVPIHTPVNNKEQPQGCWESHFSLQEGAFPLLTFPFALQPFCFSLYLKLNLFGFSLALPFFPLPFAYIC